MTLDEAAAPAGWLELDRYVAAFEEARAAGAADDLRRFAPPAGAPLHLPVLRELVRVDLELGWADGMPRSLAEYRAAYPDLFADADALRSIAYEEYRLRQQAGQA